jgi:type IV pilus assembly protein PilY1
MKTIAKRLLNFASGATLAALGCAAGADEAEIFVGTGNAVSGERPNILFIMDTSGSMSGNVTTQVPYSAATDFSGSCADDRVYFVQGTDSSAPPACNNDNSVPLAAFKCDAALTSMASAGYYIADRAAQWRSSRWRNVLGNTGNSVWVECRADAGIHGNGVNTTNLWARDGSSGPWTSASGSQITWTQNNSNRSYVFYAGNYVNWLNNGGTITQTRLQIMQQVASNTITQLAAQGAVNLGLMRFSDNANVSCGDTTSAQGGMVLREVGPVETQAPLLLADIASLNADGCTPLSETMFEAYRYLSGGGVTYGINSRRFPGTGGALPSILSSREASPSQNTYKSPLLESCQRNFIVLLTDGLPTSDGASNTAIETLIGGACAGTENATGGRCLEEIAEYMYENDLRATLPQIQNVTTYTVGFELTGTDGVAAVTKLRNTAAGAGGVFYEAKDTATLTTVLTNIVRSILEFNTSFTAPAVSVNAFNRTQNLNDLYVTVFRPSETYAWSGNIKKYELAANGTILDATGAPAVEATTGFFRGSSQSFWTTGVDGDDVTSGGAANVLPLPANRLVYSDLDTSLALTAAGNSVTTGNAAITAAMLGLVGAEAPGRNPLINWMRGTDITDQDGDGLTTDVRHQMGDPMNGRPATVIYGGSLADPDPNDGVVYAVTNEGYLHAINTLDGTELWSFMPQQLLARASDLYNNEAVDDRVYGLDANIRVIRNEVNENGVIEPTLGERVLLYFGMRRGGNDIYGLDVTDRNAPTFLFRVGPNETGARRLTNAGQSWSMPAVAKINISGASQNTLQQVLVFGGGYDTVQDNGPFVAADSVGNQIFVVDALSGNVLWYAGPSADAGADLRHASMNHSIPADVRVFDLTGDGFADRMYASDMGGRVWRFDIHNGQTRANLVTGGVFASLGNAHLTTHPVATTRRFYSAPDLSFLTQGGRTWLNVGIGSGYRGHPLNQQTEDRFYSLRDHLPFGRLSQAQYDAATVITEADVNLIDITLDITPTVPAGATGWRLDLKRPSGTWTGEKSLSEARTLESMIQFTTYEPNNDSTSNSSSCAPGMGTNRLYTISAFTGAPVFDLDSAVDPDGDDDSDGIPNGSDDDDDGDGVPDGEDPDSAEDRDSELAQGGIAPEVVWLFPSPDNPQTCVGAECRPDPVCLVGLENCGVGVNLNPVRTFWRQTGVN